jgi:hypothetical protein
MNILARDIKIALCLSIATLSTNLLAQGKTNAWDGLYGQVGLLGYASYIPKSATGTTTMGPYSFSNTSTADHASGYTANIGLGYNYAINSNYVLGIGAALYPGTSRSVNSTVVTNGKIGTGTYDVSNVFSFTLIPGYALDDNRLVYAKIGYAGATINANSPGNYPQQTSGANGMVYGFGYKQAITESIYVFGEGNYAVFRPKSASVTTNAGATISSTASAVGYDLLIGVGYRF